MFKLIAIIGLIAFTVACAAHVRSLIDPHVRVWRADRLVFFAWMCMFLSKAVFTTHTFLAGSEIPIDNTSIIQLVWVAAALIAVLFMLLKSYWVIGFSNVVVILLELYAFFGFAGALFSRAALFTLYKVSLVIIDGIIIAYALGLQKQKSRSIDLFNSTIALITLTLAGALLGAIIAPQLSLRPNPGVFGVILYGVFPALHPNELGMLAAIVFMSSLVQLFYEQQLRIRIFHIGITTMCAAAVFLAQSRTAITSIVACIPFIMWYSGNNKVALRIGFIFGTFLIACIGLGMIAFHGGGHVVTDIANYLQRGTGDGGFKTLDDRANAWMSVGLGLFGESPLLGNGFDSGVRFSGELSFGHLHNSYFQVLANSGLLGFIPWVIMLIIVLVDVIKNFLRVIHGKIADPAHEKIIIILFTTMMALFARSVTGSVMLNHCWSLLLFLAILLELKSPKYRIA